MREVFIPFTIDRSSFEDLKNRLTQKDMLWKHQSQDSQGREILIFGATAFVRDDKIPRGLFTDRGVF